MSRIAVGAVTLILLILTLIFFNPITAMGEMGLCLPSPNIWKWPHIAAWCVNSVIIFVCALVMAYANKKYNFIPEAQPVMALGLLLLLGCNCVTTSTLSTSTLLLLCNVVCLFVIISTFEERNATREFFIIGTLPAIGAMIQYSFLVMIPVYIAGGILMKSFRLRELIAFIFGLIAPYWIAIGMGMISPFDFKLPESLIVFNKEAVDADIFLTLLATGIMALFGFVFALYNGVRLFSRNSRLRCIHSTFNIMGVISIFAIIFDFSNFVAYFGTIALWVAIETATLLYFYNLRKPQLALILILVIFLPLYILAL